MDLPGGALWATVMLVLRLLGLPFVLSLLDMGVTLFYQPAAYWAGDRSAAVEANPIVWLALRGHPLWLVPGFIGWYALFWFLIFRTPAWIGLRFAVFLVIGHTWAIAGWWLRYAESGWMLAGALVSLVVPWGFATIFPFRRQWRSEARVQPVAQKLSKMSRRHRHRHPW